MRQPPRYTLATERTRKEDGVLHREDYDEQAWKDLQHFDKDRAVSGDAFAKIDGVDGESLDSKHKGEIEILGWKWKVENTGSAHVGGGAGSGRSIHHGFKFTKIYDKSSPKLHQACSSGEHLKKVVLVARKAGKEQQEYLKFTLSDVLVSEYRHLPWGEPKTGLPWDGVELSYGKMEMEYKAQKSDGTMEGAIKAGYDFRWILQLD